MSRIRATLVLLLSLTYPLLVYLALGRFEPRWLALLLFSLALLRAATAREPVWLVAAAGAGLLAALTTLLNDALPLKMYPVLVNATLLAVFGISLRHPPTVVERLARLRHPQLPPSGVAYTRRVTQVWCGFFVLNGLAALATAMYASDCAWALYNGFIAYLLMGLLFAGEWLVRRRAMAGHTHG